VNSLPALATAKAGDILLFDQPKGGLGAIISLVRRSSYYHVAIFEGETFTIEAHQRGVVRRDLRTSRRTSPGSYPRAPTEARTRVAS